MTEPGERLIIRVLVMRSQLGDEDAFQELVERISPRLHYFLRKLVFDQGIVSDLLQEVWFDVFRQLPGLDDAGAFSAWVYRIARGKAALHVRRNVGHTRIALDLESVSETEGPDEFAAEDFERVHAALDRLNVEHREVLVLRFLEEMSYQEIGEIIGCPVGTVRSRIHYAKRTMKHLLDKEFKT